MIKITMLCLRNLDNRYHETLLKYSDTIIPKILIVASNEPMLDTKKLKYSKISNTKKSQSPQMIQAHSAGVVEYRQNLCRGVRHPGATSVLDMTLNNLR